MQKKYETLFGKNIIPINKSSADFERILQRAYMKVPPFITSGTDKGFKDSLMWLSVIDYFKANGESEIIFVSNDNGFKENANFLCAEFEENTGKKIDIKDNSYYKSIFDEYVSATDIFSLDDRVKNGNAGISITELEDAYKLVEEVKKKYPEYLKQFYSTTANIFNNNYEAPCINFEDSDDSDLPF